MERSRILEPTKEQEEAAIAWLGANTYMLLNKAVILLVLKVMEQEARIAELERSLLGEI